MQSRVLKKEVIDSNLNVEQGNKEGFMEEVAFVLSLEESQPCCSQETFQIQGRTCNRNAKAWTTMAGAYSMRK